MPNMPLIKINNIELYYLLSNKNSNLHSIIILNDIKIKNDFTKLMLMTSTMSLHKFR